MHHCVVCAKPTQFVVVVAGASDAPTGRILNTQFRPACNDHRDEVGEELTNLVVRRGATVTTSPKSVRSGGVPAWRREVERELGAQGGAKTPNLDDSVETRN